MCLIHIIIFFLNKKYLDKCCSNPPTEFGQICVPGENVKLMELFNVIHQNSHYLKYMMYLLKTF